MTTCYLSYNTVSCRKGASVFNYTLWHSLSILMFFCTSENRHKYPTVYSLNGLMTSLPLPHHKILFIQLLLMIWWVLKMKFDKEPVGMQNIFCQKTDESTSQQELKKKHIRLLMQTLWTTGSTGHTPGSSRPRLSGNEDNFAAAAILWYVVQCIYDIKLLSK